MQNHQAPATEETWECEDGHKNSASAKFCSECGKPRVTAKKCPKCGSIILKTKVGGRGTYYCDKCQKLTN